MTKTNKKKQNSGKKKQNKPSRSVSVSRNIRGDPDVVAAMSYLALLRDPCAGKLVHPTYTGTDAGYLVRTTDIVSLTAFGAGMTAGSAVACSVVLQFSPANVTTTPNQAFIATTFAPGGADPGTLAAAAVGATNPFNSVQTNFISNAVVGRYRPVAACLKWIPTGAYGARSGLVCSSYVPSSPLAGVGTIAYSAAQAQAQHVAPNGSEHHETRWLPTAGDEVWNFVGPGTSIIVGQGSVQMVLRGVDGIATSATTAQISGYFEATTVWEWIPSESSVTTNGITLDPRKPLPFTTQQVLSKIQNLGDFLYGAVQTVGNAMGMGSQPSYVPAASRSGFKLLTSGMGSILNRGPGFYIQN